jgi:hypothetical protein
MLPHSGACDINKFYGHMTLVTNKFYGAFFGFKMPVIYKKCKLYFIAAPLYDCKNRQTAARTDN